MSSFLLLNGIDVPCSVSGGAKSNTEEIGSSRRAIDGTMLVHRRATKVHPNYQLTPQADLTARAFRDLVLGKGHYWSFDANVYSSKGLGPTLATNSVQSAGSAYLGTGKLAQSSGASNKIQYTVSEIATRKRWTVVHARQLAAGAWHHYVAIYDGSSVTSYVDGVVGSAQSWLTVTVATGLVELDADASNATQVDELVILPYQVPSDWPAQIYTMNNGSGGGVGGTQWSLLARLNATGTGIEGNERTVQVKGTAKELSAMPSTLAGGSFAENNQTFAFELEEV